MLGKMELIRIDDAMWKLVEMWVCVLERMAVEIISTDDGGCEDDGDVNDGSN